MNEILASLESSPASTTVEPWMLREQLYRKRNSRDRLIGQMLDPSRNRKPRRRLGFARRV